MMAEDYMQMGMARVEKIDLPEPYKLEKSLSKKILVIGGGITGMSAALDAAKTGYAVTIVEKRAELGGHATQLAQTAAHTGPLRRADSANGG
jgi:quinone-modifying oxidoreductase subunit QmoB